MIEVVLDRARGQLCVTLVEMIEEGLLVSTPDGYAMTEAGAGWAVKRGVEPSARRGGGVTATIQAFAAERGIHLDEGDVSDGWHRPAR